MKKGLSIMEKQIISSEASKLLFKYGYNEETASYVDISELASLVGFKVGESKKLDFPDDGFMAVSQDKNSLIIVVNDDRTLEEKRFIVAHELAHYILHYVNTNLTETIMHREHIKGKSEDENDADFFAACILMPEKGFKRLYDTLKKANLDFSRILDCLQTIYKTPRESIRRRIEEVCHE